MKGEISWLNMLPKEISLPYMNILPRDLVTVFVINEQPLLQL